MTEEKKDVADNQNSGSGDDKGSTDASSLNLNKEEYERATRLAQDLSQENTDLKTKVSSFEQELADLRKQVKDGKIKDKGGDPDLINQAVDERTSEIRTEFQNYKDSSEKTVSSLQAQVKLLTVEKNLMGKVLPLVNEDVAEVVTRTILEVADLDPNNPKNIIFKDAEGKPSYSKKNPSQLLGIDEFVEELKSKHPSFFKRETLTGTKDKGTEAKGDANSELTKDVDVERLKTDRDYYLSIEPRSKRVELAKMFNLRF